MSVDEHVWHHVSTKPIADGGLLVDGPKELTGMVDLSRDSKGRTRARLLDLVPGRSGAAYADWRKERNETFRAGIQVATLDPFQGYKNLLDDQGPAKSAGRGLTCAFFASVLRCGVCDGWSVRFGWKVLTQSPSPTTTPADAFPDARGRHRTTDTAELSC